VIVILATNTSSIPIIQVAQATGRPEQVIGLQFFNPVPIQRLVEVIPSVLTSELTIERTKNLAAVGLGKTVITAPDRAGFVVNALLVGPLKLTDLIGLDTLEAVADSMYEEFKEPPLRRAFNAAANGQRWLARAQERPGLLRLPGSTMTTRPLLQRRRIPG
jgi:3-hydroxyacyl-CoA dehydrogenase